MNTTKTAAEYVKSQGGLKAMTAAAEARNATVSTYPEINVMSKTDAQGLNLGLMMRDSIVPEALADLDARMDAMRDRLRRLGATAKMIERVDAALRQARMEMGR